MMPLSSVASILGKLNTRPLVYLSLLFYPDAVEAAIWEFGSKGKPTILGAVTQELATDSWEERRIAADKCVTTLEDIAQTTSVEYVILGFPAAYLTKDGDIIKDIKPYVKKIMQELGLKPIGFVSIYQAIVYKYKKDEGLPPSLILLGFTAGSVTVSLYRVGAFCDQVTIPKEGSIAEHLEDALSQCAGDGVLPSRIILYGTKPFILEQAKKELLRHPWTARSNFMHFPKIEILPGDGAAIAVSYAGAGELAKDVADQQEVDLGSDLPTDEESVRVDEAEEIEEQFQEEQVRESVNDERINDQDEEGRVNNAERFDEQQNVVPVDPSSLGFAPVQDQNKEAEISRQKTSRRVRMPSLSIFFRLFRRHSRNERKRNPLLFLVGIILLVLLGVGYYIADIVVPRAEVVLAIMPKDITVSETILVDPSLNEISENAIPGGKQEQSETGEKTIRTTGKKIVGEPAKGTVTIVNKSTVSRTFKKGTVLSASGIEFTLDRDVSIASASETFQGITYAKETVSVTAKDIGTKGNIPAGREFTISGVSSTIASARNDTAFTGGTSKEIQVVARSDHEQIVKEVTQEVTQKGKESLKAATEETVIPETIKTTIVKREFSAEIGQEAREVTGKITVSLSGIGYRSADLLELFQRKAKQVIPEGYELSSERPTFDVGSPRIGKDGSIRLVATMSAVALPNIDASALAKDIAGKPASEAKEMLQQHDGVRNVDYRISSLFRRQRFPKRSENIRVVISQEQ